MLLPMPQLKAIAALTLLSPYVPLLFQGEEWGARTPFLYFTDHENEELGRAVAAGRSQEFSSFRWQGDVPNPQELATFERSKLDWSELRDGVHAELYEWHRELIRLRRTNVAQNVDVAFDAEARWLTMLCGDLLAVFNFADQAQAVPLPAAAGDGKGATRSDGERGDGRESNGAAARRPGASRHWRLVLCSDAAADGAAQEYAPIIAAHATLVYARTP
jgi:maltooligosyltrehalose trehalohydrolase